MDRGLAVILVILAGWFVWFPGFRPSRNNGESYGIDVSAHQGHIDWQRVARRQISFAYIKATEGSTYTDPQFAANWSGASAVGVRRGAYHFFSLCSSGLSQARNFLHAVSAEPRGLPPAVDLELGGNCSNRPSTRAVATQIQDFFGPVQQATGQTVVVYLGSDFAGRYHLPVLFQHPLWLRRIREQDRLLHPPRSRPLL